MIAVNVTSESGELLGRFMVNQEDLLHPDWIGQEVVNQLPSHPEAREQYFSADDNNKED